MTPITITIPGRPQPLQRHRMARSRSYDTAQNRRNKYAVQQAALQVLGAAKPLSGPLAIEATFAFVRPKSAPKRRTMPEVKPDVDNLVKLLLDALNGVVWRDDAQVVEMRARKIYANVEQTRLVVRAAGGSVE
jgi:Holliday junction resolvase RusA-like endonuclease